MIIQAEPEELDSLVAKLELTFTQRLLAVLEAVPMENPNPLTMTDAGSRMRNTTALIDKVQRDHPTPNWRDLL